MADHPLRSATDRRLGRLLPYQPANQTQAHPSPINLWPLVHANLWFYAVLIPVSRGYTSVKGRLPTRYSPVRRFPLLASTEVSACSFSLDLHVLSTPPAFILSQDQTLNLLYKDRSPYTLTQNFAWRFLIRNYCFEIVRDRFFYPSIFHGLYIVLQALTCFDNISTLFSFQCPQRFPSPCFATPSLEANIIHYRATLNPCQEKN